MTDPSRVDHVTRIGGVFFRCRDPEALVASYRTHLGVPVGDDGYVTFSENRDTLWVLFPGDTASWPADRQTMVNFTVRDLDATLSRLRAADIAVGDHVEQPAYRRFGWFVDPEGNRVEPWEPPRRDET